MYPFYCSQTLTTLNISGNLFGDKAVEYLADIPAMNKVSHSFFSFISFFCFETLKEINLRKNKIGNDGIKSLAQSLQNNTVYNLTCVCLCCINYFSWHLDT